MTIFVPYTNAAGDTERVGIEMNGRRRWIIPPRCKQVGHQDWVLPADAIRCNGNIIERFRRGFHWNGNSTFWPLSIYLPPGEHPEVSLPHDSHYQYHFAEVWDVFACEWVRVKVSKAWSDAEFQADDAAAGVRLTKTWAEWLGVHLGGWPAWLTGTCNGRHSPTACPADAWSWCPYRYGLPPVGDIDVSKPQTED